MSPLAEIAAQDPPLWLAGCGLLLGLAFGALVQRTGFCAMGAISDLVLIGDTRRLKAWLLAGAVALAGTQLLWALGLVPLQLAAQLSGRLSLSGSIAGGLLFGLGMVLAGGCASRSLVRLGSGDAQSFLVVGVLAVVAGEAQAGRLEPARLAMERLVLIEGQAGELRLDLALGGGLAAAVLVWCLSDRGFRGSTRHMLAGLGIGALVALGFLATGLAADAFSLAQARPASLTFVRPAHDLLQWLGAPRSLPGFGVAAALGTLLGAALAACWSGTFRAAGLGDAGGIASAVAGAALMGFGGILAGGCTIGQGVTGIATLAIGSFVSLLSLVIGGLLGVIFLLSFLGGDT